MCRTNLISGRWTRNVRFLYVHHPHNVAVTHAEHIGAKTCKKRTQFYVKWQLEVTAPALALLVAETMIPVTTVAQRLVVTILATLVLATMNVWRKVMMVLLQLDAKRFL